MILRISAALRACANVIAPRDMPRAVRALAGLLVLATAFEALNYTTSLVSLTGWPDDLIYHAILFGSTLLCALRAVLRRCERLPWALLALAVGLWGAGNLYWTVALQFDAAPPYPSLADALWLGVYPPAYLAIVLLVRGRLPHVDSRLWLDGIIAVLTAGALSATILFGAIQDATGGDPSVVATNLAYPLSDMVLLATIAGAMTIGRGRLDRSMLFFAGGIAAFAIADSGYLFALAEGTYVTGAALDLGWPVAVLLVGLAAWQPAAAAQERRERRPSIVIPATLALTSLGILVYDHFDRTNLLALGLAAASLLAVILRVVLTHRESQEILAATRHQARTDPLTGLGNRFALLDGLERALAADGPHVLLLFDLDGFKNYNDSFGHPAGDALLARLGTMLAAATDAGGGGAYRIGGDEFCVIAACPDEAALAALVACARAALSEEGEGFNVGASCGHALLPTEAPDGAEALRVADRRLYAEKQGGRVSARVQSARVLRRALDEWDAELGEHTGDVAELARGVARRLELDDDEVERIATAAELHDVGKIAIPRSILRKPGPLDAEEWAFMMRHTLIGERIAQGAPALSGVAGLIRSSHERWDGAGYPDGLAGDGIPLGAQIVFVCDSYSAMTTDRCYKPGMSEAEAVEELQLHAGTQFAPRVVGAFVAELAMRTVSVLD